MTVRGIRGATTVARNDKQEILAATKELLQELVRANNLAVEQIASVIFTTTRDLNAEFPAAAARELGWEDTPLLCAGEIEVPDSLPGCIRVLIHANCETKPQDIQHVYLKEAVNLRR